jgi:hypothetical protein
MRVISVFVFLTFSLSEGVVIGVSQSKNIRVGYPYNISKGLIEPKELYNSIS